MFAEERLAEGESSPDDSREGTVVMKYRSKEI